MRTSSFTGQFKRDVKLAKKRGKDMAALQAVLELLIDGDPLPPKYREAIAAYFREGFAPSENAETPGLPETLVKVPVKVGGLKNSTC